MPNLEHDRPDSLSGTQPKMPSAPRTISEPVVPRMNPLPLSAYQVAVESRARGGLNHDGTPWHQGLADTTTGDPFCAVVNHLHSAMDHGALNYMRDFQIFSSEEDAVPRLFLECMEELWSKAEENTTTIHTASQFRKRHSEESESWENMFNRVRNLQSSLSAEQDSRTQWYCMNCQERLEYTEGVSSSFVLFVPDFFLAYDDRCDLLGFCCPLSGLFEVHPSKLCFDKLVNKCSEPQVHFIVRRLVQLTGLSWKWDCLAKFEQELPRSEFLSPFTNLLNGVSADVEFSSVQHLLGFNVSFIKGVSEPEAIDVGLEARGASFYLKSTHNGAVYCPECLPSSTAIPNSGEESDEELDNLCITVGGEHEFNLAYIPKHQDFELAKDIDVQSPRNIKKAALDLGYGKQMAYALYCKAWDMLHYEKPRIQNVTLRGVQSSLIMDWKTAKGQTITPLSFRKRIRARQDSFLVLNEGEIWVATSKRNITWSTAFGLNAHFAGLVMGAAWTQNDILTKEKVTSIYGALYHLFGDTPKLKAEGTNWYQPTRDAMREITCALTFLHVILAGKVRPWGMFSNVIPHLDESIPNLQDMCFDMPMPYGIEYYTHGKGYEPDEESASTLRSPNFFRVAEEIWDCSRNSTFPAIVGGPHDDETMRKCFFPEHGSVVSEPEALSKDTHLQFTTEKSDNSQGEGQPAEIEQVATAGTTICDICPEARDVFQQVLDHVRTR